MYYNYSRSTKRFENNARLMVIMYYNIISDI